MFSTKKIKFLFLVALPFFLLAAFWIFCLFTVPTFDLDESLYRRAAEEMKRARSLWQPTWDTLPLYHKPPIFYWLIILASNLIDSTQSFISSIAARLPSLLSSIGILLTLYYSNYIIFRKKQTFHENSFAPLLYLCAFIPVLTGTAVIFDPLQTFSLMPALLLITRYFILEKFSLAELTISIISVFAAAAVKGLNGIIVPAIAFGLHGCLTLVAEKGNPKKFLNHFSTGLKIFIPASLLCFAYYYFLDQKMGRAFTEEFFLVHHFGRSQQAMETHGGSFFYYPLIVWLGGGFLSYFLGSLLTEKKWNYFTFGFPLTFSFSIVLFFSFSATKLPHYTWPLWAMLALQGGLIQNFESKRHPTPMLKFIQNFFFRFPLLLWSVVFFLLASNPVSIVNSFFRSEQSEAILNHFAGIPAIHSGILFVAGLICLGIALGPKGKIALPYLATFSVFCSLVLGIALVPVAKSILFEPQEKITLIARDRFLKDGDCINYTGPHSPSLSLVLGYSYFHNRCEGNAVNYLIAPEWKKHECLERGMVILAQEKYLYLCGFLKKN